jgi:hypothetical protein
MRKFGGVRAWFSPYLSYMLLRIRTRPEVLIRIVAPKVAGSSPVGHPSNTYIESRILARIGYPPIRAAS